MQTTYDVVERGEASPFDGSSSPHSREMTFKVATPEGVRFDQAVLMDGMSTNLHWLWPGKIPFGRVTLLEGPAGVGKSFVALDLVARLSDDRPGTAAPPAGSTRSIRCSTRPSSTISEIYEMYAKTAVKPRLICG